MTCIIQSNSDSTYRTDSSLVKFHAEKMISKFENQFIEIQPFYEETAGVNLSQISHKISLVHFVLKLDHSLGI